MADIKNRKIEHINIVTEKEVEPIKNIFDKYRIPYSSLPEIDLAEVDCTSEFLGYSISMPVLLGSMTGGPELAKDINKNLAISAQKARLPLALGSMRVIMHDPDTLKSFQVKQYCPNIPLIGNIGLVQLNYGIGIEQIKKIIKETQIDALFFHVNPLQEAVQPEGDVNFKGLLNKLAKIIKEIEIPVMIKEVGSGIDKQTAKRLRDIGVKYIDVAGLGGTSWTIVEAYRRHDDIGFTFGEVGIRTDQALIDCSKIKGIDLIAGGGIRSGLDVIKSIMLGAKIASIAKPILVPAISEPEACEVYLAKMMKEIKISMFAMGIKDLDGLRSKKLIVQ